MGQFQITSVTMKHSEVIFASKWHQRTSFFNQTVQPVESHAKITRCKAKPGCSPSGDPPRLLIIVDSSVNWFSCVHAAFAHLVVSRRMRMSRKCVREGERPFPGGGQCLFPSLLVLSWMTAQSLLHTATKKMSESVKKNRLPRQRPLSDRNHISYRSSTPIRLAILKISKIGHVLSKITGLEPIVKTGSSFGS